MITTISIISVICLLLFNASLVGVEHALIASQEGELKKAAKDGIYGAQSALNLRKDLEVSLDSVYFVRTFATFLLAFVGIPMAYGFLYYISDGLGYDASEEVGLGAAFYFLIILFFSVAHLFLGHTVARSISLRSPEIYLRNFALPIIILSALSRPFTGSVAHLRKSIYRVFNLKVPERIISGAELELLLSQTDEHHTLDKDDEEMIQGVVEFSKTIAREVMTPRTDIVTIDKRASFAEVVDRIMDTGFSRIPVIDERIDNVVGLLLARDLMAYISENLKTGANHFSLTKVMREPYFIPNSKPIDDLLSEFKKRKLHMAIVLDEHGGVDGLVTLEDLIEEIVGDIFDESDQEEKEIIEKDGHLVIDGGVSVHELNEKYELAIPIGDYNTVAGFIMAKLGRMPKEGDSVDVIWKTEGDKPEPKLIIQKVDGHRIESVKLLV